MSVRAPRFSPDGGKLIYLECEAGGAHCKCLKLKMVSVILNIYILPCIHLH